MVDSSFDSVVSNRGVADYVTCVIGSNKGDITRYHAYKDSWGDGCLNLLEQRLVITQRFCDASMIPA